MPPHKTAALFIKPALVLFALILVGACTDITKPYVRKVFDGDTLGLSNGQHVRLIGINTPELSNRKRNTKDEPLAREAQRVLSQIIKNHQPTFTRGEEAQDRHGRMLAYMSLPNTNITAEEQLLKRGLAFAIAIPPNLDRLAQYRAAENEARQEKRGVWALSYYRAIDVDTLTPKNTGFRRVTGIIKRHRHTKNAYRFYIGKKLTLIISKKDWKKYFSGQPKDWVNKKITARGWISHRKKYYYLRLSHPGMIES